MPESREQPVRMHKSAKGAAARRQVSKELVGSLGGARHRDCIARVPRECHDGAKSHYEAKSLAQAGCNAVQGLRKIPLIAVGRRVPLSRYDISRSAMRSTMARSPSSSSL